ncbi:BadF/BadG/BcrA/BcrD ATPase family protein [Oceanobacillus sp. FSL K6-2867]|uniref:N-acetylglucosamine kinase n=1 Tax=Oceanobacillus sp. FSL K6-2867 TaxID=2954748 RepID=UPI0030D9CEE5
MMYVLGIDGGGTKTKGVITKLNGEKIAEATVGPTNPNSIKKSDLKKELCNLFTLLKQQNTSCFFQLKHVFAGMSGVGHPATKNMVQKVLTDLLPEHVNITVETDAINALYSGTLGKPGIVQIAGTGSITFGLNKEGVSTRIGGWGHLIGEMGSGFALGRDALEAAFLAHDGLGKSTIISESLLEHFQAVKLSDIIHFVYQEKNQKERVASLSKIVMKAADNGDQVAQEIIRKNAEYMGKSIAFLLIKLFYEREEIPIVVTGGIFNRLDLFQTIIEEEIRQQQLNPLLIVPKMEPVGGAVVAALIEENIVVCSDFVESFIYDRLH